MNRVTTATVLSGIALIGVLTWTGPVRAQTNGAIYTQCPGDTNGDGIPDVPVPGHPDVKCMHLAGGDGFVTMADRPEPMYIFGFSDVTGLLPSQIIQKSSQTPAPLFCVTIAGSALMKLRGVVHDRGLDGSVLVEYVGKPVW